MSYFHSLFCEWGQLSRILNDKIFQVFKTYGYFVGNHPKISISIGLIVTVVFSIGLKNFEFTGDYDLFIPHSTQGYKDGVTIENTFGELAGGRDTATVFIATTDTNILDEEILQRLFLIDEKVLSATSKKGQNFSRVCQPISTVSTECTINTIFAILGLSSPEDITANIDQIPQQIQELPASVRETIISGLHYNDNGSLISAEALSFTYLASTNPDRVDEVESWESTVFPRLEDEAGAADGYTIYYFNQWGIDEESLNLVIREVPLMVGTILIILVYMCIILGGKPLLKSRILLGSSIIVTILSALGIALGLACYLKFPMTVLSPLVMFILLGVGVDDMIIIVDCFETTKRNFKSVEEDLSLNENESIQKKYDRITERFAEGLGQAAYAITITSVTSATAFFASSFVDFLAISYFCLIGGFGICSIYFLQLTVFAGLLVLDERRIETGRYDILPCFRSKTLNTFSEPPLMEADSSTHPVPSESFSESNKSDRVIVHHNGHYGTESANGRDPSSTETKYRGFMDKFMSEHLAWYLSDTKIALVIVIIFAAVTSVAVVSMINISTNADNISFYSPDSFVRQFFDTQGKYFRSGSQPLYIYLEGTEIQYETNSTRAAFQELIASFEELEYVDNGTVRFWLHDLEIYMEQNNLTLTESNFYSSLNQFLLSEPFNYTNSLGIETIVVPFDYQALIVFGPQNTSIEKTIFAIDSRWDTEVSSQIKQVSELRGKLPNRVFPLYSQPGFTTRGSAFVWGNLFSSIDRDDQILGMIVRNLLFAALGVGIVSLLFCHPGLVLLILACVLMIDIDLLGLMAIWGVSLDLAAFICLAMAIGLSVDYVVHIGHAYMRQFRDNNTEKDYTSIDFDRPLMNKAQYTEDKRKRAYFRLKEAFLEIGTSVLNGGLTTFLGICLLALAQSPGFQTFFRILFGTVAFGLLHGLFFAPTILTVFAAMRD